MDTERFPVDPQVDMTNMEGSEGLIPCPLSPIQLSRNTAILKIQVPIDLGRCLFPNQVWPVTEINCL